MSLTVKVTFEKANGPSEIRRIPVNTADADFFTYTKEKIREFFPALARGNFTLYWQDPDGDRIAFSSTEEMKEAMTSVSDNVLRVFVSEPKESAEKTGQGQQQKKPPEKQQRGQSHPQGPRPRSGQGQNAFKDGTFVFPPKASSFFDKFTQGTGPGTFCMSGPGTYCMKTPGGTFCMSGPGTYCMKTPEGTFCSSGNSCTISSGTGSCRTNIITSNGTDFLSGTNNMIYEDFGTNMSTLIDPSGVKVSYNYRDGNGNRQQENYHHNWRTGAQQNGASGSHQHGATKNGTEKMFFDSSDSSPENVNPTAPKENVRKVGKESSNSPDDWIYLKEDGGQLHIPTSVAIPLPPPTNLRIQQNLQQLLAMGFTDVNGWLTVLLTEHNGDLEATLDAIMGKFTQSGNMHDSH